MQKLTRAYKIPLYHNPTKWDVVRYTSKEYNHFLSYYTGLHVFGKPEKAPSTAGLGWIANQALHAAKGKAEGLLELKEQGNKINIPYFNKIICPAKIQETKSDTSFSHWLIVSGAHRTTTYIPTRLTKPIKKKISKGWSLSDHVEIHKDYVLVYITKEKPKMQIPSAKALGIDIGWNYGVSRSDGYIGRKLKPIALKEQKAQKERSRQGHHVKRGAGRQTQVKQLLDIEAKRYVARCQRLNASPVIESQEVIANLKTPKFNRWARTHFAKRLNQLGEEVGMKVFEVHPSKTSITCSNCGAVDKRSRQGIDFKCVACGFYMYADLNASRNVAENGTRAITAYRDAIAKKARKARISEDGQDARLKI